MEFRKFPFIPENSGDILLALYKNNNKKKVHNYIWVAAPVWVTWDIWAASTALEVLGVPESG